MPSSSPDCAVHALRDVGPLRNDGLVAIARAQRPWSIETLRVSGGDVDALLRAKTLPNLHTLELCVTFREDRCSQRADLELVEPSEPVLCAERFDWAATRSQVASDFGHCSHVALASDQLTDERGS